VSVDTYLRGKDTRDYLRVEASGVDVLVAPALVQLTDQITLRVDGWLVRRLTAEVAHEHGPACQH
jgi:hypothetical protein